MCKYAPAYRRQGYANMQIDVRMCKYADVQMVF